MHHGKCMKMFREERKMEGKWVESGTCSGNFPIFPGPIFRGADKTFLWGPLQKLSLQISGGRMGSRSPEVSGKPETSKGCITDVARPGSLATCPASARIESSALGPVLCPPLACTGLALRCRGGDGGSLCGGMRHGAGATGPKCGPHCPSLLFSAPRGSGWLCRAVPGRGAVRRLGPGSSEPLWRYGSKEMEQARAGVSIVPFQDKKFSQHLLPSAQRNTC